MLQQSGDRGVLFFKINSTFFRHEGRMQKLRFKLRPIFKHSLLMLDDSGAEFRK